MVLWRLTRRPYADLRGRGGELADGRWHTRGRPVVYCAASAALAVLVVRVHLDLLPDDYVLMRIEALNDLAARTIRPSDLPTGWRSREDLCRPIGDAWLEEGSTALLSVPSSIVEVEGNTLLNPRHPEARYVTVAEVTPFGWDERLFR